LTFLPAGHDIDPFVSKFASRTGSPNTAPPIIRSMAEFARYVGLARTTVSRVLNGQPGLRSKTIERVRRAIEKTGFTPNAHAMHLRGKRTATIGFCMENLLTPTAVLKAASLQRRLRERGYAALIEVLEPGDSLRVIRHFLSLRVDAVVFIGHFVEEEIAQRVRELRTSGTPHLVIDQLGIAGADTVALDRAAGMRELVTHLLMLGHRTFGLLGMSGSLRAIRDRLSGIEAALASRGLTFAGATRSLDSLHARDNDFEYGRALVGSFVEERDRPTAFVALNDEIAIGALHALQAAGLRVPQDVSVAGFNNQDVCLMPTPRLTSVDQRIRQTVETAANLLLAQIDRAPARHPLVHMIEPLLVARESTGPAPSRNRR
jgi:DNA-binding LacI/PurR family transcriptional regulator